MLKIGDRIKHFKYGEGEIVHFNKETESVIVYFDKKFDVIVGGVIDDRYYFEDTRRVEKNNFIEVAEVNIEKINNFSSNIKPREVNCYRCKKSIRTETDNICTDCGWIICECGSCGCQYKKQV